MAERVLIIPIQRALSLVANLPADAQVLGYGVGPCSAAQNGDVESIFVRVTSAEFRDEDGSKPLELLPAETKSPGEG